MIKENWSTNKLLLVKKSFVFSVIIFCLLLLATYIQRRVRALSFLEQQRLEISQAERATSITDMRDKSPKSSKEIFSDNNLGIAFKIPHSFLILSEKNSNNLIFDYASKTEEMTASSDIEVLRIEKINQPLNKLVFTDPPSGMSYEYNEKYDIWFAGDLGWLENTSDKEATDCVRWLMDRKKTSFKLIETANAGTIGCEEIYKEVQSQKKYTTKNNLKAYVFAGGDAGGAYETAFIENPQKTGVIKIFYIRYELYDGVVGNNKTIYSILDSLEFIK